MYGQLFEDVPTQKYLGVTIQRDLSWKTHITEACKKANRTLGFVRRNLYMATPEIKKRAYVTLVRPHLEYASAVWDPHYQCYIDEVEKIQRRAARFSLGDYSWESSVTEMLKNLQLHTLQLRRQVHRLCLFHQAFYRSSAILIPVYVMTTTRPTRSSSSESSFINMSTGRNYYQHSFFPMTITQWNLLPADIRSIQDFALFKAELEKTIYPQQ
jgi:hypothetical protein